MATDRAVPPSEPPFSAQERRDPGGWRVLPVRGVEGGVTSGQSLLSVMRPDHRPPRGRVTPTCRNHEIRGPPQLLFRGYSPLWMAIAVIGSSLFVSEARHDVYANCYLALCCLPWLDES